MIGFCPQFDILWDELTPEEHLSIYAEMKGLAPEDLPREIAHRLKAVNLSHVRNHLVRTFSGGMKRRLSIAISSIADPQIIFLDEPTTGMDPHNRREVWNLIHELKKNRVVILTTHAMDEADALSDKIAVIVDGTFKCIGTPLYLKNHFGEGYRYGSSLNIGNMTVTLRRLSLVTAPETVPHLKKKITELLPSAKILDEKAGSILTSIPLVKIKELKPFFKY